MSGRVLRRLALAAAIGTVGLAGCASEYDDVTYHGSASVGMYYGAGYYDPWYYGAGYYPPTVIVPPGTGIDRPGGPQVENPIANVPGASTRPSPAPAASTRSSSTRASPSSMSSRPAPRPTTMRGGGGRRR